MDSTICSSFHESSYCIDSEAQIVCEICFEEFDGATRPPKLFPCGHNFCETCIFSMCCHQEYYLLDSIKCPTCRRSFPMDTARQAPTNYDLCKMLDHFQKKKDQNVTVIHVPDVVEEKPAKKLSSSNDSKHLRCNNCQKKIVQKNLFRVARFCVDCTSTARMTIVCLECCVNHHNGHELYTEDQLHFNQLKVLTDLRKCRQKIEESSQIFDERMTEIKESGRIVCISLITEKQNLLTYTLASIDDVLRRIESGPIMFPPILKTIREEQFRNYNRFLKLRTELENSLIARKNAKPTKCLTPVQKPTCSSALLNKSSLSLRQSKVSLRGDDTLWHEAITTLSRLMQGHPMAMQLEFHHSTVNSKDTVEMRKRKIMSCAHAATCMLDSETQVSMIPLFADVLLNCFFQLNTLSKSKFIDKRTFRRSDIWKQIQISYTELFNTTAKNFPAYHPERVDILDDLAYLCHMFSDVCDQATVTICIIEAARSRAADASVLSLEDQKRTEQRLLLIDEHLSECRRQQKLSDLRKTSKKKGDGRFKKLFRSCFMPQDKEMSFVL